MLHAAHHILPARLLKTALNSGQSTFVVAVAGPV